MSSDSSSPADHFSRVSAAYAGSRPRYPTDLFDWLAGIAPARDLVWDCATGSGQAAVDLARHFAQVVATDLSAAQIERATPAANVAYRVGPAQSSGLDDASCDLVAVAQALHWFDLDAFYAEVRRVLRPGGVIAAWTYGVLTIEGADVDTLVQRFYGETVGPYWPPDRRHVETAYRDLAFPFARIAAPHFDMQADWTLDQLSGYFRSWSATGHYIAINGHDPVDALTAELKALWGDAKRPRRVTWPLGILAGRVD